MIAKYEQVFKVISMRIDSGVWYEGMLMPTEHELCDLFGVSRITIRKAMAKLEDEALIQRIQGKGTFVGKRRFHSTESAGFLDSMAAQGRTVKSHILSVELIEPTEYIHAKLQLGGKNPMVWHFSRLRLIEDTPVAIMDSYIPRVIGDSFGDYTLENSSFYHLIQLVTGKAVVDTQARVSAIIPTDEECRLLQVPPGSAHLQYRSVGYLDDGRPVEVGSSIFNAELYEFAVRYRDLKSVEQTE